MILQIASLPRDTNPAACLISRGFTNYSTVIPFTFAAVPKWDNGVSRSISKIDRTGLAFKGIGAIGAVVARFVHTEEVTGSNPVSPTPEGPFRSCSGAGLFVFLVCGPDGLCELDFLSVLCERVET